MVKAKALRVPGFEGFGKQLSSACTSAREPLLVPLTVVGLAYTLLGMPVEFHQPGWQHFAESETGFVDMQRMWAETISCHPFLRGHIHHLTGWMHEAREVDKEAAVKCWAIVAGIDMLALAERERGEILGPLYLQLRSASWRKAHGAVYTPQAISELMAEMNDIQEGMSVQDPCCGCGGMLTAAARVMRKHGRDPRTVRWVFNDIDPLAVAIAGVNAAAAGMGPHVELHCGNALAPSLEQRGAVITRSA